MGIWSWPLFMQLEIYELLVFFCYTSTSMILTLNEVKHQEMKLKKSISIKQYNNKVEIKSQNYEKTKRSIQARKNYLTSIPPFFISPLPSYFLNFYIFEKIPSHLPPITSIYAWAILSMKCFLNYHHHVLCSPMIFPPLFQVHSSSFPSKSPFSWMNTSIMLTHLKI